MSAWALDAVLALRERAADDAVRRLSRGVGELRRSAAERDERARVAAMLARATGAEACADPGRGAVLAAAAARRARLAAQREGALRALAAAEEGVARARAEAERAARALAGALGARDVLRAARERQDRARRGRREEALEAEAGDAWAARWALAGSGGRPGPG